MHGVATAWALEARSKGSKDWEKISVVLHSSYPPEAMSAIQESGATVFVPCVGKDDAVSTSASGALETPKRTPKAEGGGASAGKVAAALAPPAAVASQSTVAISSPSKSPSKQLNLDSLDIKVTKDVVQKYKSAKEARGGGASGYKLTVNLSGVVTTSGRAKVVGVINLVDRRNAPCWILKPDVLIDTLQALTENPHLACLSDLAKSAKEVPLRDIPCGADVGKLSYSKTGSAFPITTTMFSLDVSEKIRPPAEEAVCLVQMLHEVVTSKVFKEAYTDMMVNGGGRWAKLGSQIEQDNHSCWVIFKGCNLEVVDPSPLNTVLMETKTSRKPCPS